MFVVGDVFSVGTDGMSGANGNVAAYEVDGAVGSIVAVGCACWL